MYYQEIRPGVYLGTDQKLHSKLPVCPYCGRQDVYSHAKYRDKCVDCGNLYNLYTVRRAARKRDNMSLKVGYAHVEVLEELIRRRDVLKLKPMVESLDEEAEKMSERIHIQEDYKRYVDAQKPVTMVRCDYCGDDALIPLGSFGPFKCKQCQTTYDRYKSLYKCVGSLDQDSCDELAELIRYYIGQRKKGYNTPQIHIAIDALQRRIVTIGGEKYRFYKPQA